MSYRTIGYGESVFKKKGYDLIVSMVLKQYVDTTRYKIILDCDVVKRLLYQKQYTKCTDHTYICNNTTVYKRVDLPLVKQYVYYTF